MKRPTLATAATLAAVALVISADAITTHEIHNLRKFTREPRRPPSPVRMALSLDVDLLVNPDRIYELGQISYRDAVRERPAVVLCLPWPGCRRSCPPPPACCGPIDIPFDCVPPIPRLCEHGWSPATPRERATWRRALALAGAEPLEPRAAQRWPSVLAGSARLAIGARRRQPRVRMARPRVRGAVDGDIVRRIVRAHINEVRYCYQHGLVRNPKLRGRVSVRFTIGATGRVPTAVIAESSLKNRNVGNCIAHAAKRWKFPRPDDGDSVVVTYPFVLNAG